MGLRAAQASLLRCWRPSSLASLVARRLVRESLANPGGIAGAERKLNLDVVGAGSSPELTDRRKPPPGSRKTISVPLVSEGSPESVLTGRCLDQDQQFGACHDGSPPHSGRLLGDRCCHPHD